MTIKLKLVALLLGLSSMVFTPSLAAHPVNCFQHNVLTFVQSNDEIIEIEGEEGNFDEYEMAQADNSSKKKSNGTTFKDIISYILDGIILIGFLYGFFWLRNNEVTLENHPIIYTTLATSKFSAIVGVVAWVAYLIAEFALEWNGLIVIGAFGIIVIIYTIFKIYKSYAHLDSTSTKIIATIVCLVLALSIFFISWIIIFFLLFYYIIKDMLGWDKVVLNDGTVIHRRNALSYDYVDDKGNTYKRIDDKYVKVAGTI